jgi:cbb3-type cytochrome oxidase maturation protein
MLLAISVTVALLFFIIFIFSVRQGQYDDSYTPAVRILFEDELVKDRGEQQPTNNPNQSN